MFQKYIRMLHILQYNLSYHNCLVQLLGRRACTWRSIGLKRCSAAGAGSGGRWQQKHRRSSRSMRVRQAEGARASGQRREVEVQFTRNCRRRRQGTAATDICPDVRALVVPSFHTTNSCQMIKVTQVYQLKRHLKQLVRRVMLHCASADEAEAEACAGGGGGAG
jgi:hypothetical protein